MFLLCICHQKTLYFNRIAKCQRRKRRAQSCTRNAHLRNMFYAQDSLGEKKMKWRWNNRWKLIELSHVRVELDLRLFALTYVQLLSNNKGNIGISTSIPCLNYYYSFYWITYYIYCCWSFIPVWVLLFIIIINFFFIVQYFIKLFIYSFRHIYIFLCVSIKFIWHSCQILRKQPWLTPESIYILKHHQKTCRYSHICLSVSLAICCFIYHLHEYLIGMPFWVLFMHKLCHQVFISSTIVCFNFIRFAG